MSETTQPWTPGEWELFGGRVIRALNGEVAKPLAEKAARAALVTCGWQWGGR